MLKRTSRASTVVFKSVIVALLWAIGACNGRGPAVEEPTVGGEGTVPRPILAVRQFPCDSLSAMTLGAAQVLTDSAQANEMHDCQKLIFSNGNYGPLVAIYPLGSTRAAEPAVFDSARPVASIFNWGARGYPRLGIGRDLNCLWLKRDTTQANPWSAVMTGPSGNDWCRSGALPDLPHGISLDVNAAPGTNVAATSRWGWGIVGTDSVQYVGIRCGGMWCRIGPDGFTPLDAPAGVSVNSNRRGYHDDQRLAIPSADSLIPGPWARITPVDTLERIDSLAFRTRQVVAIVELRGTPAQVLHYDTTWNLKTGLNTLSLWHKITTDVDAWYLFVRSANGEEAAFEVERTPNIRHAVPGAVRWRWDDEDESAWIGCDDACCSPKSSLRVNP